MSPSRDEQDYEGKRQQIIDGALSVFARKGFEKATNREIADAARIGSPGLIYHYFNDKADLFRQVLEERAPALQLVMHGDEMMDLPPRQVLTTLGNSFLATLGGPVPIAMFKMMLGEAVRRPVVAEMFNKIGPGRGLSFLARYLAHQMDLGVLRRTDPGAAARCFMGPLLLFLLTQQVFVQPDASSLSGETMVVTAVDIFLSGMQVNEEEREESV
ncbi:MAG: TetR/AcrR family transcriptional regulator [Chloroflexi bacterium]|nr:TetR/AcrR family transcriptional regulator [Chloroflexota bacterium]